MHSLMIAYDLPAGSSYTETIESIKRLGPWAHVLESTWLVCTERTAREVRDAIVAAAPAGAHIFVGRTSGEAAWINVLCSNEWIKNNI